MKASNQKRSYFFPFPLAVKWVMQARKRYHLPLEMLRSEGDFSCGYTNDEARQRYHRARRFEGGLCVIQIRSDYAGGNIKAISQDEVVRLEQDLRDSVNWWFYWNFCARCEEEREIVFEFTNGEVIGPWGPTYSMDGMNWTWLGEQSVINSKSFVYRFVSDWSN
jgi:hypothetical protein